MQFTILAKRPKLSLFLAGAMAVLALPPVNVLPFMFLSIGWLALLIGRAENGRTAFWRGWCWGVGYFIFGWYWISFALRFEWPKFAWLLPLSILALPSAMAVYIGIMGWLLHKLAKQFHQKYLAAIFLFPIFFTAFEILRGHLFTGFPWNIIGSAVTEYAWWLQGAAVIGIYGMGFLICASVCLWLIANDIHKNKIVLRAVAVGVWIIIAAYGYWRMHEPQTGTHNLNVRIVQPDTAQDGRWDGPRRAQIFNNLTRLTSRAGPIAPDLVVWPEAAAPYILTREPVARHYMGMAIPPDALLATGSIRRDPSTHQLFNSIEYLNSRGEILGHYDKFHLVPFGEYMPFSKYIHIQAVAEMFGDLGRGAGPETQTIHDFRISPLICYEAIFPGEVTASANGPAQSPQLLLNVTDDVWYGNTSGPYQHLAAARARAVEEGIPLVRAANNGISAAVDRFGTIIWSLPYDMMGMMDAQVAIEDAPIPPPAAHGMFYAWLSIAALAYLGAGFLLLPRKKS